MSTEVGSLQAGLSLDISSFMSSMTEATNLVRSFGQQLQEALGGNFSQGFQAVQRQVGELQQSIVSLQGQMSSFAASTQMEGSVSGFEKMQEYSAWIGEDISGVTTGVADLANSVDGAATKIGGLANGFDDATQGAKETATGAAAVGTSTDSAGRSAKVLKNELGNSANAANKVSGATKSLATDMSRIVSGIVISQGFYKMLNVVEGLVSGSADFMNNMAQAQIAYTHLLGSATDAKSMITSMQDFAVASPLDTAATMNASRQLMAMGFSAKSVIPTLRTLADTASVFSSSDSGIDDMISRMTLAIGQIKASGTMMGQEMRQLYNAGIPVFEIFKEQLGLTANQIRNIGKQGISADVAITALLKGMQKRYAGAAKEFTQTIPGAFSTIEDSLNIIFNDAFQVPYQQLSKWINMISTRVQALAVITRAYGSGGLVSAIFPPALMPAIRNVVGALQQLGSAMSFLGKIAGEVFGSMATIMMQVLSYVLPPISILVNALAQMAYWVIANVPGLKQLLGIVAAYAIVLLLAKSFMLLWNVLKIGAICTWLAQQFALLWGTMKASVAFFAANKWAIALMLIVAALVALIMTSERARASLSKLFGAFSQGANKTVSPSLNIGFDPNKILQPTFKAAEPSANKYNGTLADIADNLDDVGKNADKTKNKLKDTFNQSFDEVYSIDPTKDTDAASTLGLDKLDELSKGLTGVQDQLDDLKMSGDFAKDWGAINPDSLLGGFDLKTWSNTFWQQLVQAFQAPEWVGTSIGALIGGAIGLAIGHPLIGAAVGALIGYIVGLFWPEIQKQLGISAFQMIGTSIGAGLGFAIGWAVAGPTGALIGAAIGALVGNIGGMLADGFINGKWNYNGLSTSIGIGIGAAIGMVVGGPAGAAIGAAIGGLVGDIVGKIITGFKTGKWDSKAIALPLGTLIGAGIGMVMGGPAGAAIGAAIGTLVGDVMGKVTDGFATGKWDTAGIAAPLGVLIGGAIGMVVGGPGGALIGAAIGALVGWIATQIQNNWPAISAKFNQMGTDISKGFAGAKASVGTFINDCGANLNTFFNKTLPDGATSAKNSIGDAFNTAKTNVTTAWAPVDSWFKTNVWTPVSDAGVTGINIAVGAFDKANTDINNDWQPVSDWFQKNVWAPMSNDATNMNKSVTTGFNTARTGVQTDWGNFSTWFGTNVWTPVQNGATAVKTDLGNKFNEAKAGINTNWSNFSTWFGTNVWSPLKAGVADTKQNLGDKFNEAKANIQGGWNTVSAWFGANVWTPVTADATKIGSWIGTKFGEAKDSITGAWVNIGTWFQTNVWDPLTKGFTTVFGWIGDRIKDLKNALGGLADAGSKQTGLKTSTGAASVFSSGYANGGIVGDISGARVIGHATGGIFNREHVATFAEGGKSEAIIPLQNEAAMAPFVEAVATRLAQIQGNQEQEVTYGAESAQQPIYAIVGTLIADDAGLKKLERKLTIIRKSEDGRILNQ